MDIKSTLRTFEGMLISYVRLEDFKGLELLASDPNGEVLSDGRKIYVHRRGDDFAITPVPARIEQPTLIPTQPPAVANLQDELYLIDRSRILAATTPAYRQFLEDSGYGDLNSCSGIGVAKGMLKYDQTVRDAAREAGLSLTGSDGDYVVNINHPDARKLVEALGYKVLTTGLMYKVFIPYIQEPAQQGNPEAQATLDEMISTKAEWLEDLILDKTRLKIGTHDIRLVLPDKDGRFDRADIDEFGFPIRVRDQGEFYYFYPRGDESAVFRNRDSELDLILNREPSIVDGWLGVRRAKIFPQEMKVEKYFKWKTLR